MNWFIDKFRKQPGAQDEGTPKIDNAQVIFAYRYLVEKGLLTDRNIARAAEKLDITPKMFLEIVQQQTAEEKPKWQENIEDRKRRTETAFTSYAVESARGQRVPPGEQKVATNAYTKGRAPGIVQGEQNIRNVFMGDEPTSYIIRDNEVLPLFQTEMPETTIKNSATGAQQTKPEEQQTKPKSPWDPLFRRGR